MLDGDPEIVDDGLQVVANLKRSVKVIKSHSLTAVVTGARDRQRCYSPSRHRRGYLHG